MAITKNISDALEEIRKQWGSSAIFGASENFTAPVESITSGSLELDDAIGVGGYPCGRVVLLSGIESSGKTFLTWMAIKEAQKKKNGIALYIDAEYSYDPMWVEKLGIDRDRLLISQTSSAVEAFELLLGRPEKKDKEGEVKKKALAGVLQNKTLIEAGLTTVVIDSINALQPPMEISSEVGKSNMALMARFLPPELRKLTPLLSETGITCFCILQARENPNQMFGDSLTVSGGRALRHAASLWINCKRAGKDIKQKNEVGEEISIGHPMEVRVEKNKVAPPKRRAEVTIYYEKGIDIKGELVSQGIKKGVVKQLSAKKWEFNGEEFGGKNQIEEKVQEDKSFAKALLEAIKESREVEPMHQD